SGPTTADSGQIAALDLRTGRYKTLIRGGSAAVFVEPGFLVYSTGGMLQAVRVDPRRLEGSGEPVPVGDQGMNSPVGSAHFSVSRNGRLVYVAGGQPPLNVAPRSLVWGRPARHRSADQCAATVIRRCAALAGWHARRARRSQPGRRHLGLGSRP